MIKFSSFSILKHQAHSLWFGSLLGRVFHPRSIPSCYCNCRQLYSDRKWCLCPNQCDLRAGFDLRCDATMLTSLALNVIAFLQYLAKLSNTCIRRVRYILYPLKYTILRAFISAHLGMVTYIYAWRNVDIISAMRSAPSHNLNQSLLSGVSPATNFSQIWINMQMILKKLVLYIYIYNCNKRKYPPLTYSVQHQCTFVKSLSVWLIYIYIYIYIDKNVFKTTRSFCYQWFHVSTLQANANRPFILSSMKRTTGSGHLENIYIYHSSFLRGIYAFWSMFTCFTFIYHNYLLSICDLKILIKYNLVCNGCTARVYVY